MQVSKRSSSSSNQLQQKEDQINIKDVDPCMYQEPPTRRISMEKFEQNAFDRFQVLHQLDLLDMGGSESSSADIGDRVFKLCRKHGLTDPEKDVYSHFTLRLAFCKTEEWRRWFCKLETRLFRYRFEDASDDKKALFLARHNLSMELADVHEVASLWERIKSVPDAPKKEQMKQIYKVPFELALDLVASRKVFVNGGVAYVPFAHVVSIVVSRFRSNLSKQLAATFRASHRVDDSFEERFEPLMKALRSNQLSDHSYQGEIEAGAVTLESLETLVNQSFPLCMQHSYVTLKRNHHLKHEGRMQFGLFLKGIGLSMEDALTFWRDSFYPRTAKDKFDKVYAYNVRHNYGKEGKRANYTPYGCMKIISTPGPGSDTFHGCPFKLFDSQHLTAKLKSMQMSEKSGVSVQEIVETASKGHCQLACQKYFMATHPGALPEKVGNHPNSYVVESRKYHEGEDFGESSGTSEETMETD